MQANSFAIVISLLSIQQNSFDLFVFNSSQSLLANLTPFSFSGSMTTLHPASTTLSADTPTNFTYTCAKPSHLLYGSSCYVLVDQPMHHFQALMHCSKLNMKLASVHSKEETVALRTWLASKQMYMNLWIGLIWDSAGKLCT